jgi:biopolymer transport protein ExbD
MGRRVKIEAGAAEIDMTPIIDIVFNLIIFFMIASELNNRSVEQIEVPYADRAEKLGKIAPGVVPDKILQINVLENGVVKVRGLSYSVDPTVKGNPPLSDFIQIEAAAYEREAPAPGQTGTPPSALRVNIRADRRARFRFVQGVFDACVKNGVYKTSVAADPNQPKMN